MVVVIETSSGQRLGLLLVELAEGHAGFQPQRFNAFDHLQHIGHVLRGWMLPGRAHAEARRANRLGFGRGFQHFLHFHQFFFIKTGVVVAGLRAIFAVFRTGTGLDRQQRGHLDAVRIEMLAMHGLRLKQQVVEGLFEERFDFGEAPVVTSNGSGGGAHKHSL